MAGQISIKYFSNNNIDKQLWDNCVALSANSLIYATSSYLDIIAPGWGGLVYGNYLAVMPLPVKRKLGFSFVYHPLFAQQLGVFSNNVSLLNADNFLKVIPRRFIKVTLSFNSLNNLNNKYITKRINHILPLNNNYSNLQKGFDTNTKRNIKKVVNSGLIIDKNISVDDFLIFKKSNMVTLLKNNHFATLYQLYNYLVTNNIAQIWGVRNSSNQLLCAACLVNYKLRITYLMAASSADGKKNGAMFLLVNNIITEYAQTNHVLDFEGSMIPGVARFFKGFGAIPKNYCYYSKWF